MKDLCKWDRGWRHIASGVVWLAICLSVIGCMMLFGMALQGAIFLFTG